MSHYRRKGLLNFKRCEVAIEIGSAKREVLFYDICGQQGWKILVVEFAFTSVSEIIIFQVCNFTKKDLFRRCFAMIYPEAQNSNFVEHLLMAVSESFKI